MPRANLPGGLNIVKRDQLDELLQTVACHRLDPRARLGVRADTPIGWQAGVGDIADQHVLERVLGAIPQRRTGPKRDQRPALQPAELGQDVDAGNGA